MNPLIALFFARSIALNRGASPGEATKAGVLALAVRPPLGFLLALSLGRRGAPAIAIDPVLRLTAVPASPSQINLFWNSLPGAETYSVFRTLPKGREKTDFPDLTDLTFSDLKLDANTTYHYHLQAFDADGKSLATSIKVWAKTDSESE